MDIAFAAVFVFAAVLTFYSVMTIEEDMNEKSWRPIFVLAFAAVAWLTSIALLGVPISTTVYYPSYTISAGGTSVVIPAYTVTQTNQTPIPIWGLNEYLVFASAMAAMCFVMLVMYMLGKTAQEVSDTVHNIANGG